MINKIKKILGREYVTLNNIEISKSALVSNFKYLSGLYPSITIAPVVKSNAYGHGIINVAKIVDPLGLPMLCVDSLHEAYELTRAHIKTPVLIMGYVHPQSLKVKKLDYSYVIYDYQQARILNEHQPGARVHVKVDTGMHRLGIPLVELDDLASRIKTLKNLEIEGLMSHLSSPKISKPYTNFQIKNYKEALRIFAKNKLEVKWKHLGASGGLLNSGRELSQITNMARVGISFYGLYRTNKSQKLKPALSLTSKIVQIKSIKKGEFIGYDLGYRANNDMTIAVLPIGYNDGVDRRLTNKGFVKVKNNFCLVVGKVSMNITAIDITNIKVKVGDSVNVFSDKLSDKNSFESTAQTIETIPHELLVHLNPTSIKRTITP